MKKRFTPIIVLFSAALLAAGGTAANRNPPIPVNLTPAQGKQFLKSMYTFISNPQIKFSEYNKYFTNNTYSYVNGETSSHQKFIKHLHFLRKNIISMSVSDMNVLTAPRKLALTFNADVVLRGSNGERQESKLRFYSFYYLNDKNKIKFFEETSIPLTNNSNNSLGKQSGK